jgi:zinc protease
MNASRIAMRLASLLAGHRRFPWSPARKSRRHVPRRQRAATNAEDTLTTKFEVSGIPVILRRVTANNVVAANLYLLGGTRQLTPATQGIENFLLEATEHGTAKYPRDVLRGKMALLGSTIAVGPGWTGRRSAFARRFRTSIPRGPFSPTG